MGSGKSLYGAEIAVKYWREGAIVHSNIDFRQDRILQEGWGDQFVPLGDDPTKWIPLIRGGKEGQENLIVIDEGMFLFDAHDWQSNKKRFDELYKFLIWTRKLGLDVYMIGQAQKGMDVQFTRMALNVIACVAVKRIPVMGPFLVSIKGDFLRVWKTPDNQRTGKKEYVRFDPFIGEMYRTESTHGRFSEIPRDVRRKPVDEKKAIYKAWAKMGAIAGVLLGIFGGAKFMMGLALAGAMPDEKVKDDGASKEALLVVPARVETPVLPESVPSPALPSEPPKKKPWRVWGTADWGRNEFWEAGTRQRIAVGSVFDDEIVEMITIQDRLLFVKLESGETVRFRPFESSDRKIEKLQETNPWKKLNSSLNSSDATWRDGARALLGNGSPE